MERPSREDVGEEQIPRFGDAGITSQCRESSSAQVDCGEARDTAGLRTKPKTQSDADLELLSLLMPRPQGASEASQAGQSLNHIYILE